MPNKQAKICTTSLDPYDLRRLVEEFRGLEKSIRHALSLFDDGFKVEGEAQLRASIDHLSKMRGE
jgi:hypothetical protein